MYCHGQKTKSVENPWPLGFYPMAPGKNRGGCLLVYVFQGVYLNVDCLLTRPESSADNPGRMVATYCNTLESMKNKLTTTHPSVLGGSASNSHESNHGS
ncbi:hypothetical protein TNCV_3529261 [Trichonephila clavipes]|uniref:Uncharacterized protein n=1 Tax=Trichonephila clavipes TaxID=2585209 RepID=A0A8X6V1G9_TRICX|nr:hypothetical protein TNCV_3529261 [Trichonephila clavipes]